MGKQAIYEKYLRKLPEDAHMDAAWAALEQQDEAEPVSYTHLDVYKRQTQKRSRLIAIIPFAGVSLMYDIMNPIGFILEVPAELRMRRKQRKKLSLIHI